LKNIILKFLSTTLKELKGTLHFLALPKTTVHPAPESASYCGNARRRVTAKTLLAETVKYTVPYVVFVNFSWFR